MTPDMSIEHYDVGPGGGGPGGGGPGVGCAPPVRIGGGTAWNDDSLFTGSWDLGSVGTALGATAGSNPMTIGRGNVVTSLIVS